MDPGELVTSIFSLFVILFVFSVLWTAFRGGDVTSIVSFVSSFAMPFVVILLIIFGVATIISDQ